MLILKEFSAVFSLERVVNGSGEGDGSGDIQIFCSCRLENSAMMLFCTIEFGIRFITMHSLKRVFVFGLDAKKNWTGGEG